MSNQQHALARITAIEIALAPLTRHADRLVDDGQDDGATFGFLIEEIAELETERANLRRDNGIVKVAS